MKGASRLVESVSQISNAFIRTVVMILACQCCPFTLFGCIPRFACSPLAQLSHGGGQGVPLNPGRFLFDV